MNLKIFKNFKGVQINISIFYIYSTKAFNLWSILWINLIFKELFLFKNDISLSIYSPKSTVGANTIDLRPSFLCYPKLWIIGKAKVKVLPLPVGAKANKFLFSNTMGIPWLKKLYN